MSRTISRSRSRTREATAMASSSTSQSPSRSTISRASTIYDIENGEGSDRETGASSPDSATAHQMDKSTHAAAPRATGTGGAHVHTLDELRARDRMSSASASASRSRSRGRPQSQARRLDGQSTSNNLHLTEGPRSESKASVDSLKLGEPLVDVSLMSKGASVQDRNLIRANYIPSADELQLPKGLPALPKTAIPTQIDERDEKTPDKWLPRDPRLVRLTGKHPFNVEPPLPDLFSSGFLTPIELWYVRNHGYVPRVEDNECDSWELSIDGLVDRPLKITLAQLKAHPALPVVTLPVTMVCAGNRRKEQNVVQKSLGFSWGGAGVSTALFTGVMVADLMSMVGIQRTGKHVIFEGIDELPNGKYGTSLRRRWCMDEEMGVMLSWGMNGEGLRPDHGKPLRLVVPGHIGGRSVKWLNKITVSDKESQHHLHFFDNRVLPMTVGPDEARNVKDWWYDPRYIINELNVQSVMAHPAHDEVIDLKTTEPYELQGYAFSGGGRRVTRVEVTIDQGQNWILASIVYPEDLYRSVHNVVKKNPYFGTVDLTNTESCFCWCLWRVDLPRESLKTTGVIAVRAMDESMNIQPKDMYWNPTGMMNTWWFKVAIHHNKEMTEARAEHPTMPGTQTGGWMQRLKDEGQDPRFPQFKMPGQADSPEPIKQEAAKAAKKEVPMTKDGVVRKITMAEVEKHNEHDDCWFVVNGHVYDGVPFMKDHPGGADSIVLVAGADASDDFMTIHSSDAKKKLAEFHIGVLDTGKDEAEVASKEAVKPNVLFLEKTKWKKAVLSEIERISHDTRIFRFALEHPEQDLGLPCGQHVFTRLTRKTKERPDAHQPLPDAKEKIFANVYDGEVVQRAYTPVSRANARGYIDMLIKVYFGTPQHPPGGRMSMGFEELELGDHVEFKGPLGGFVYLGKGVVQWKGQKFRLDQVGFVAGGSGITPILAVLRGIMEDESEEAKRVRSYIVYANRTEGDILCRDELESLQASRPEKTSLWYVVSSAPEGWRYTTGFATAEILNQHLPPAPSQIEGGVPKVPTPPKVDAALDKEEMDSLPFKSVVLLCGPPPMMKACTASLQQNGWDPDTEVVSF